MKLLNWRDAYYLDDEKSIGKTFAFFRLGPAHNRLSTWEFEAAMFRLTSLPQFRGCGIGKENIRGVWLLASYSWYHCWKVGIQTPNGNLRYYRIFPYIGVRFL